MFNPYETCLSGGYTESASSLAKCLADLDNQAKESNPTRDLELESNIVSVVPFIIYSASLVFFMQAGFAMVCAGSVRKKNVQNTTLKNLLDLCGSAISFYFVGYAFAYGGRNNADGVTFIGDNNFLLLDLANDESGVGYSEFLFQFSFAATSATIVAGTLAERCQMNAYLMYSMMLTGFVYPVVVHAIWSDNGFLSNQIAQPLLGTGMYDFAGSGVVHVTGGITALIATKLLGERKGRFHDNRGKLLEEPKTFPGHSKSLQMLGTLILWFGWIGFNGGSALADGSYNPAVVAVAVVNTVLAGAAAGVVALFTNLIVKERLTGEACYNLGYAMNGCLAGLAAITGSCGIVEPWAALVIGIFAGLFFLGTSMLLVYLCLDDAVDAIPVHLTGGTWGVIATGLFASPTGLRRYLNVDTVEHVGLFYSADGSMLGCQVIGLLFIIGWVTVIMLPFFVILNYLGMLRADSLEEIVGLDASYHGWNPIIADDVTQGDIDEYHRQSKKLTHNRGSRHSIDESEHDSSGVDQFE